MAFSMGFCRPLVVGLLLVGRASTLLAQPQATDPAAVRAELDQLRAEFEAVRRAYGDRLSALEARLLALEGETPPVAAPESPPPTDVPKAAPVPSGAEGAGGPQGGLPVYGNVNALSKIFNPDVAVIGNFVGAAGSNPVNPSPALEMREAETSLQAIVDPYARADFFFAFGPDGADFEEGYITFPTLPGGLLAKVGKMRGAFGKTNLLHPHVLPWTDRPLVSENLLGGEEGLAASGFSVARLVPNRWMFLEFTGEVFGSDSALFNSPGQRELSYVGHLRGYQDVTESSNLDLGGLFVHGHNGADESSVTRLMGLDATFRYRPLRRATGRRLLARTELMWSRRSEAGDATAFGAYASADYQFARRWFAGLRYDHAERAVETETLDTGMSWLVTFWPSEFSQVRGQYRRTRYAESETAHEVLFQFLFSIGAHGAHVF